jgi:hypothetical protein
MVFATYEKHRVAMGREDPIDEVTLNSVFNGLLGVLEPVRRALTSAYRTDESLETLSETTWTPSSSACFESSRQGGGQKGHVTNVAEVAAAALSQCGALFESIHQHIVDGDLDFHEEVSPSSDETEEERIWFSSNPGWEEEVVDSNVRFNGEIGAEASYIFLDAQRKDYGRTQPILVRMQFFPKVTVNGRVLLNHVIEFYEYAREDEVWDDSVTDAVLTYNTGRSFRCEIFGILEPLKVRVISKGEGLPYYASKELQKRLHAILRQMDCFRLIGRPLCPTDLMDCVSNPVQGEGEWGGPLHWFSVDYSSATDCLSASLSEKILKYLTQDLPARMREIFLRVLAPHECHYPPMKVEKGACGTSRGFDERCVECEVENELDFVRSPDGTVREAQTPCGGNHHLIQIEPVQQKNGQLMGSPLSFPILCIANLGLYLEVIKSDPRPLKQKLKGVLVNGDDMLYVAPPPFWKRHVDKGRTVGLEMTPGKAYMHRSFANANSTCFVYDLGDHEPGHPDQVRSTPWQVDFFNTGLFFGQNKVLQKDTSVDSESPSWKVAVINQLLKGALPGCQSKLLRSYLVKHRSEITKECVGRNLFIAPSLGGMGVDRPLGWRWKVTDAQRVHAALCAQEAGPFACFGRGPTFGPVLEEPRQKVSPWWDEKLKKAPPSLRKSYWVSKGQTFLKNSLLEHGFRVVGFRQPSWRRSYYNSSAIVRAAVRPAPKPWEIKIEWGAPHLLLDWDLQEGDVVIYRDGVAVGVKRASGIQDELSI